MSIAAPARVDDIWEWCEVLWPMLRDDARRAGQRYLDEKRAAEAEIKTLRGTT